MTEKMPKIFWEIYSDSPRESLGDKVSTRKAYRMHRVARKLLNTRYRLLSRNTDYRTGKAVWWAVQYMQQNTHKNLVDPK